MEFCYTWKITELNLNNDDVRRQAMAFQTLRPAVFCERRAPSGGSRAAVDSSLVSSFGGDMDVFMSSHGCLDCTPHTNTGIKLTSVHVKQQSVDDRV